MARNGSAELSNECLMLGGEADLKNKSRHFRFRPRADLRRPVIAQHTPRVNDVIGCGLLDGSLETANSRKVLIDKSRHHPFIEHADRFNQMESPKTCLKAPGRPP